MYGTMTGLWNHISTINKTINTRYNVGKVGQKATDGVFEYDCHGLLKNYAWTNGKPGGAISYLNNGLSSDDWIKKVYDLATKKGDIGTIPKHGSPVVVYSDNFGHIAVYCPSSGTTIECCAGNTNKVVERPLGFYDGTPYKWQQWSNLYWCPETPVVQDVVVKKNVSGYLDYAGTDIVSGWAWDSTDDPVTVTIKIMNGNTVKKTYNVKANAFRDDLKKSFIGNGKHGFSVVPDLLGLAAGKYTVIAYVGEKILESSDKKTKTISVAPAQLEGKYRVQINSFTVLQSAKSLVKTLGDKKITGIVIRRYGKNYRVQTIGSNSAAEQSKIMERLRQNGYKNAYVTTDGGTIVK